MTVSSEVNSVSYSGNGATQIFAVPYYFLADSHLRVVLRAADGTETVQAITTNYTVSGAGNPAGGQVTMLAAPDTGVTLVILRNVPATQETDYVANDPFPAESHERALDKLTMLVQQGVFEYGRALRVPDSDPEPSRLPPTSQRANQVLGFDALGDPIAVSPASGSATELALRLADGVTPGNGADMVGYDATNTVRDIITSIKLALGLVKNIVTDFGAVGDGVADDTAAFNAAIAYHNARGGIDFLNVLGTTIFVPDGRYKIGATNPIARSGFELVGSSRSGAILLCQPGTTTFTFGNGTDIVVGGGINNLKVEYLTTPTVSTFFCTFDYAYRVKLENLLVANIGTLCRLGVTNARASGGIVVSRIDGSKANVAASLLQLRYGAGLFLDQVHVFVPVGVPTHPASMTTVPGCGVFDCSAGFWDTLQATNCLFERFDIGISIAAGNGMVYQNFFFSNAIFDYHRRYCLYAESQVGGVISGIRFDDSCWFASWESNTIEFVGAGYHDNHNIAGKIVLGGANGVQYSLTGNTRNVVFQGLQVNSINRQGTGTAAMNFAAGAKGWRMIGCGGNVDTTAIGFPWRAAFGVVIGVDADFYVATGNRWEGSTNGWSVAANTAGSINRYIGGNASANYAGSAGLALPASGVTLNNTTPYKVDVHVNGGTVTGITSRGVGLANMTSGFLTMDPGQSLAISYSVAPSFTTFARS